MIVPSMAYAVNGRNHPLFWPFSISFTAHVMLLGLIFFSPDWSSEPTYIPSVVDVQMVDLKDLAAPPAQKKAPSKEKAPVVEEQATDTAEVSVQKAESKQTPEISVAPPRKKTKKALKYKTFKSKKVIKNALKRVEKKVDTQPPKPLEDTIKRLREKVAKEGKPAPGVEGGKQSGAAGKTEGYGRGTQKEIELIDLYRLEIAYAINKNWAFSEQLSGGRDKLTASIVFKVMPDGEIVDIFFADRSGNQYLDDSAYKAIVKSSPVKPHPAKLSRPYVEMGLRFTPEGVQ
ncbi:MAG: TonB C-terminal domain-containing protein [Desulfobacteraceae bacterium]